MTRRYFAAAAAALAALAATPARAEPISAWGPRLDATIGGLLGGQRIGTIQGTAGGLVVDAGVHLGRFYVFGEYDFLSVGQDSSQTPAAVRGFMHRVGGNVRYSFAVFEDRASPQRADIWAELGTGHQRVRWHEGGRLDRRDISFGLGGQATFGVGRNRPRTMGLYMGLKGWVAAAPERKDAGPMCAGPCDDPTGPASRDLGVFFHMGMPFGF